MIQYQILDICSYKHVKVYHSERMFLWSKKAPVYLTTIIIKYHDNYILKFLLIKLILVEYFRIQEWIQLF